MPAGAVIWLIANVTIGGTSLAEYFITILNPIGIIFGLNGIILLAYVVAIPANEIVIPTILMLTVLVYGGSGAGAGMFELDSQLATRAILDGWLDAADGGVRDAVQPDPQPVQHYDHLRRTKTGSRKWTAVAALLPLVMGFAVTFIVAQIWRLFSG